MNDVEKWTDRVLELLAEKTKQGKLRWGRQGDDGDGNDHFMTQLVVGSCGTTVTTSYSHVLIGNRKVKGPAARRLYHTVKDEVENKDCSQVWLDALEAL
jgi:hypothetical protein